MYTIKRWRLHAAGRIILVWAAVCYVLNTDSLGGIVSAFLPLARARGKSTRIGMFPSLPSSFEYDEEVVFFQRATGTRISGKEKLQRSIRQWEDDFRSEVDGGLLEFRVSQNGNNRLYRAS